MMILLFGLMNRKNVTREWMLSNIFLVRICYSCRIIFPPNDNLQANWSIYDKYKFENIRASI